MTTCALCRRELTHPEIEKGWDEPLPLRVPKNGVVRSAVVCPDCFGPTAHCWYCGALLPSNRRLAKQPVRCTECRL